MLHSRSTAGLLCPVQGQNLPRPSHWHWNRVVRRHQGQSRGYAERGNNNSTVEGSNWYSEGALQISCGGKMSKILSNKNHSNKFNQFLFSCLFRKCFVPTPSQGAKTRWACLCATRTALLFAANFAKRSGPELRMTSKRTSTSERGVTFSCPSARDCRKLAKTTSSLARTSSD